MGARAKRQRQQRIRELTDKISQLESCNKQNPSNLTSQQLTKLRYDLRLQLLEDFEKASKKLKMTYYATNNKAGKTLSHRIKGHRHKTKIPFILHPLTKHKLYHPQDIADTFSHYYSSLYNLKDDTNTVQPSTDAITSFLQHLDIPTLTQEHLQTLNRQFTIEEINKAIDSLPNNKSPGPDGFSGEYYKTFKHLLIPYMERTFSAAVASASFPPEMLSATIVTLPKPGKEPNIPSNFRPISLLNSDLKIYAKIIASRLLHVLPLLIHPDQTGFTKGRQTSDATRRLINIIHLAKVHKRPSLLLALDAEKAFDRIHWQYLTQVLYKFLFYRQYIISDPSPILQNLCTSIHIRSTIQTI